jgi:hypothetical protein
MRYRGIRRSRGNDVDGKGLMLGVIALSLVLWGVLMFSLSSNPDDGEAPPNDCLAQENC